MADLLIDVNAAATDLAVGFTSNQAERDVRPVKVQQRTSGGCWRTLDGLADFAIVQSYVSIHGVA
jgi:transposase